ncbi:MAG: cupin domain-containing protein [Pseudomonadota bacterium]
MSTSAISPKTVAAGLEDTWSPRVVAAFDEHYVKVARLHGTFTWHCHEDEDELFYVLSGQLKIELEDETVVLNPGDLYVVPRGVMHNPIAEEECQVMLIERKSTLHTGDKVTSQTRSVEEQLR